MSTSCVEKGLAAGATNNSSILLSWTVMVVSACMAARLVGLGLGPYDNVDPLELTQDVVLNAGLYPIEQQLFHGIP